MRAPRPIPLLILLASAACRRETPPLAIDPSLDRLAPGDTVMLAGARMDEIRRTPAYTRLAAQGSFAELDKFARETGFDPRKDVRQLLLASNGKDSVVLAKGTFPVPELEKQLERRGARRLTYQGRSLMVTGFAGVAFLDGGTAAAGPELMLKTVIDQAGRSQSGISQPLREKMKSIPAQSQLWAVTLGFNPALNQAVPPTGNLSNLRRVIESLDSAAVGIDLRSGLKLDATGACRTEQDARMIHDGLRGLIGIGRLATPDNEPDMLRFYDSIRVSQDRTGVRVQADIPMEVVERFLAKMEGVNRSRRP